MCRLAWSVAWASLLVLVVAVVDLRFLVVVSVVFLGGMTGSERVSRRRVEVSVQIYCQELDYNRSNVIDTKSDGGCGWRDLASTYVLHPS